MALPLCGALCHGPLPGASARLFQRSLSFNTVEFTATCDPFIFITCVHARILIHTQSLPLALSLSLCLPSLTLSSLSRSLALGLSEVHERMQRHMQRRCMHKGRQGLGSFSCVTVRIVKQVCVNICRFNVDTHHLNHVCVRVGTQNVRACMSR